MFLEGKIPSQKVVGSLGIGLFFAQEELRPQKTSPQGLRVDRPFRNVAFLRAQAEATFMCEALTIANALEHLR